MPNAYVEIHKRKGADGSPAFVCSEGKEVIALRKFFAQLDDKANKALSILVGLSIAMLIAVVTIQVVTRYILHKSIGGIEEMPIFLMMICVWLAAPLVARADAHLKIELLQLLVKDKQLAIKVIKVAINVIIFIALCFFVRFAFVYVTGSYEMNDITPGLRIPIWWMHSFLLISPLLMAAYYFAHIVKSLLALKGRD